MESDESFDENMYSPILNPDLVVPPSETPAEKAIRTGAVFKINSVVALNAEEYLEHLAKVPEERRGKHYKGSNDAPRDEYVAADVGDYPQVLGLEDELGAAKGWRVGKSFRIEHHDLD